MKTIITETFRRVVATTTDSKNKDLLKADIERLFSLPNFKADFKDVKTEIKPSVKDNVLVIDINGDGADSVSRKLKDIVIKHRAEVKIKNEKPMTGMKEGKAMPSIIGSVLNKLQDDLGPEVANPLWRDKAAEITDIINSVRNMTGTSTGQKVQAAADRIKKLQTTNENSSKEGRTSGMTKINKLTPEIEKKIETLKAKYPEFKIELTDNFKWKGRDDLKGTFTISYSGPSNGKSDQLETEIDNLQTMNENKKPKLDLRKMILEAMEVVKAEAKAEKEEGSEEETSDETPETESKPKSKKLEKDEIGKFYIVTRPSKAEDEIVHETNVLDLVTKIKGGAIDPSRILGAFKKRGGANALAKVHLKQIASELEELQNDMKIFREAKKTADTTKQKAKQTILKYKPNSDETETANV